MEFPFGDNPRARRVKAMVYDQKYEGISFRILLPVKQRERLANRCFRGKCLKKAGNFRLWDSFESLMEDVKILELFLAELSKIVADLDDRDLVTESFTLEYGSPVGWASTISFNALPGDVTVEYFLLNRRGGTGMKVVNSDFGAPLTSEVTFIVSIRQETRDGEPYWLVFTQSIYPGTDVGELEGDVSEREGVAFFDFAQYGSDFPEHSEYYRRRVRVLPRFLQELGGVDQQLQDKVRERLVLLCREGACYPSMKTHPLKPNNYWPEGTKQIRINAQWRLLWLINKQDGTLDVVGLVPKGDKRLPYDESSGSH
jgi:hypothetical protein